MELYKNTKRLLANKTALNGEVVDGSTSSVKNKKTQAIERVKRLLNNHKNLAL